MHCGVVLPGGTAPQQLELALVAEQAGWDGVFVWEAAYGVDAWTLLGAIASRTTRVKLGTMLTPLPWRRPWKVASQAATLDQLSHGRAVVAVGSGAVATGQGQTGEALDVRRRAEMLDEGIDLLQGFWRGDLAFSGAHYQTQLAARGDLAEAGAPVQANIPLWVVGVWPRERSLQRALRCSGVIPEPMSGDLTPATIAELREWLTRHGAGGAFDIVVDGETPLAVDDARAAVAPWANAGATWWLETQWAPPRNAPGMLAAFRARVEAGPPAER
ncbi:MAG: LLM class flavin-dependent oxidoreductase [Thermomicrobiales bacterium]